MRLYDSGLLMDDPDRESIGAIWGSGIEAEDLSGRVHQFRQR